MKTLVILLSLLLAAPVHAANSPVGRYEATTQKQAADKKEKAGKDADGKKKRLITVTFDSSMHCENCVKKLTDNLAYAKGVKDLKISLETNTITVTYDAAKTDEETLAGIIRKLGYTATRR